MSNPEDRRWRDLIDGLDQGAQPFDVESLQLHLRLRLARSERDMATAEASTLRQLAQAQGLQLQALETELHHMRAAVAQHRRLQAQQQGLEGRLQIEQAQRGQAHAEAAALRGAIEQHRAALAAQLPGAVDLQLYTILESTIAGAALLEQARQDRALLVYLHEGAGGRFRGRALRQLQLLLDLGAPPVEPLRMGRDGRIGPQRGRLSRLLGLLAQLAPGRWA